LQGFAATNLRDKLYALIPTSLDGADLLHVEYELSVGEVYTRAALSFFAEIPQSGYLRLLHKA
jgi:hypothetical protein